MVALSTSIGRSSAFSCAGWDSRRCSQLAGGVRPVSFLGGVWYKSPAREAGLPGWWYGVPVLEMERAPWDAGEA